MKWPDVEVCDTSCCALSTTAGNTIIANEFSFVVESGGTLELANLTIAKAACGAIITQGAVNLIDVVVMDGGGACPNIPNG